MSGTMWNVEVSLEIPYWKKRRPRESRVPARMGTDPVTADFRWLQ